MDDIMRYGLISTVRKYDYNEDHLDMIRNTSEDIYDYNLAFALSSEKVKASINMVLAGALYKNKEIKSKNLNSDTMELIEKLKGIDSDDKFLLSVSDDVRVTIIKLIERLNYMRQGKNKVNKNDADTTMKYYVLMADMLGIHDLKVELEDLSFKYLNEKLYNEIEEVINENELKAIDIEYRLASKLYMELEDYELSELRFRVKKPYGIYAKMCQNTYIGAIPDLYSMTIVLDDSNEKLKKETSLKCYSCLGVVHSLFKYKPTSFSDYIANPNHNRYKSLNSTILCYNGQVRIKICTKQMDEINRLGITRNLYKKSKEEINGELDKYSFYTNLMNMFRNMHKEFFDDVDFSQFYNQLKDLSESIQRNTNDPFDNELYFQAKELCKKIKDDARENEELISKNLEMLKKK